MDKTVYVLGAGFSKGLNAPLQSELIKQIFEIEESLISKASSKTIFSEYRNDFKDFLENTLYISPEHFKDMELEDIYTPIDRCIIDNNSFRDLSKTKLIEMRQKINALITILIHNKLEQMPSNNYADKFAEFLVTKERSISKTIISLNWDIIIDDALNNYLKNCNGFVDYCCQINLYNHYSSVACISNQDDSKSNSIKLLKPHGSMNWLQCQRCQRLYVEFNRKIALEEFLSKPICPKCSDKFNDINTSDQGGLLVSQLIMPTFLKDLNNVQLKLIWHNAGIELSEAERIVFIGYSFPTADFELRQLLARFVQHTAEINVILKNPPQDVNKDCPEKRYKTFFGKRKVCVSYVGAEKYIHNLYRDIN